MGRTGGRIVAVVVSPDRSVHRRGDTETGSLMAGQVAGMLRDVRPVQAILDEMMADCRVRLQELGQLHV